MYKRISTIAVALAFGAAAPAVAATDPPTPDPPAPATPANPVVVTGDATKITQTTASMSGTVDMGGGHSKAFFLFGTTPEFETRSPLVPVGLRPGPETIIFAPTGLKPGTRYYYRLVVNSGGEGETRSFVTQEATPPEPSKLELARATINPSLSEIDILAPITARASGTVSIDLHAAGRHHRWTAYVDAANRRIRQSELIPTAQAAKGTGILTIHYPGDALTRPQTVRLRAANVPAGLTSERPTLVDGRLRASGTISHVARGVVRVQLEYFSNGATTTLQKNAQIVNGAWRLDEPLTAEQQAAIAQRRGTVHSYVLFTGYFKAKMRGEMRSFEVLGAP